MGKPDVNITYERIKQAADQYHMSVEQALQNIQKTSEKDRQQHPTEYAA